MARELQQGGPHETLFSSPPSFKAEVHSLLSKGCNKTNFESVKGLL